jgi:hypothetical protein
MPPSGLRWGRAFKGLAIDLGKLVWSYARVLLVLAALCCGPLALLAVVTSARSLPAGQLAMWFGVLVVSTGIIAVPVVSATRKVGKRAIVSQLRHLLGHGMLRLTAILLPVALITGTVWVINQYREGDALLSVPVVGQGICVGRLQDTLSTIAPERDPKVEKCARVSKSGEPTFMCFVRVLDPDGTYRTAPCSVGRETSAKDWAERLRLVGYGLDDLCPRPRR